MDNPTRLDNRIRSKVIRLQDNLRLFQLNRKVAGHTRPHLEQRPVIFFNASTRMWGMSQNAAFSLISVWGLQLAGIPVVHFACNAGMSRCVLGTNLVDHTISPPCEVCTAQSRLLFASTPAYWFSHIREPELAEEIENLSVSDLTSFEYQHRPLGRLVLPSLRWALRRHHLNNDQNTHFLFCEYILSAHWIAEEFNRLIDQVKPAAVVLFNGLQYPEATARWVALQRGVRVITHEVSFQPYSAFFTEGEVTAYPINIPEDFKLSPKQNANMDSYLSQRFQGEFTMAGIRFWPEMRGLDENFLQKAGEFKQIVPVFTNVVFDTSQVHANVVFPHMFAWLDLVLEIIRDHPDTLFVIRAHPDEMRAGKESNESVQEWAENNQLDQLPNILFIGARDQISSYDLIQKAKFVMVYNSSIGMEATLLGVVVLCGGKARYTQYPIVHFPDTPEEYQEQAETLLSAERVELPPEFQRNARQFLYYQLFRVSLPFGDYISSHPFVPGYVRFRNFSWRDISPERSEALRVVVDGIVNGKPFIINDTG